MKPTSMSRIGIFGFDPKIDIGVRANLAGGTYRLPNLRKPLALLTSQPTSIEVEENMLKAACGNQILMALATILAGAVVGLAVADVAQAGHGGGGGGFYEGGGGFYGGGWVSCGGGGGSWGGGRFVAVGLFVWAGGAVRR